MKKNFIHENASENIICGMAAILSRERWVNTAEAGHYGRISVENISKCIPERQVLHFDSISHWHKSLKG